MDPAVKNYLIFSAGIAIVLAVVLQFGLFGTLRSSFINGFPISLEGSEGIGSFIITLLNTIITAIFFTPAVYMAIQYLQRRGR